ncbi:MAG: CD225/dispanin family protein [Planctomycetia bacterium]|nr:CD225/dispanin family protein [Planctomycetia bacterium]
MAPPIMVPRTFGAPNYGAPNVPPPNYGGYQVPNYMVWAILELICCCLPLGIVGLVYSLSANRMAAEGRIPEAMEAANSAKTWLLIGLFLGILSNLLVFGIQFLAVLAEM